jgi:muramoyltetrapeptide carboxypeptidase
MVAPKYLQPGDTVLLVAPARSVNVEDVEAFSKWVSSNGWNLEFAPNVFKVENQFAGTDNERAEDLIWALSHPKAKAIFTGRGGYGSMRTLAAMETITGNTKQWLALQTPKWFVGFSDMTSIHLWLQSMGWQSIHGPVATQWAQKHPYVGSNNNDLFDLLSGKSWQQKIDNAQVVNAAAFSGTLMGGNLSLIYASMGSGYRPQLTNGILLLEDLDEYLYHIDRMVQSMKVAGLFKEIKALIVGSMIDMKDNVVPFGKAPREIIVDALGEMGFPILFDVEIGHDHRNRAVKLGCDITFDLHNLSQES